MCDLILLKIIKKNIYIYFFLFIKTFFFFFINKFNNYNFIYFISFLIC